MPSAGLETSRHARLIADNRRTMSTWMEIDVLLDAETAGVAALHGVVSVVAYGVSSSSVV